MDTTEEDIEECKRQSEIFYDNWVREHGSRQVAEDEEEGIEEWVLERGEAVDDTPIGTEYLEEWEQEEEDQ